MLFARAVRKHPNNGIQNTDAIQSVVSIAACLMAERDLIRFQKTAVHEGLPYQTLISSILHKYINGRLIEKTR